MQFQILSLSDRVIQWIYSGKVRQRFANTNLIIGCGDLPYYYLEYVVSMLNVPMYYVRGNHASITEYGVNGERSGPLGGIDLHCRVIRRPDLLMAGVEGSLRYNRGPFQYAPAEMWGHVFKLVPSLLINRALFGRYLDVFVTHAPPLGIHDKSDWPHRGVKAFRWLISVFQPDIHLHGHIHVVLPDEQMETIFGRTKVLNTYGYRETLIETPSKRKER